MPDGSSVPDSRKNLYIAAGVAVVILFIGLGYFGYSLRANAPTFPSGETAAPQQEGGQISTNTSVSGDVPAAAPAINPVESANPFNDSNTKTTNNSQNNDYQNPFQ